MKLFVQIILITSLTCLWSIDQASKEYQTLKQSQALPPVDIKAAKHYPDIFTTSGVFPLKETGKFCKPEGKGFFGFYILSYRRPKTKDPRFGLLVVYFKGSAEHWKFENDNETFAELTLSSSQIKLWNKIGIGTSEKDLLKFIGKNFHYKKGTLLYSEINEYALSCTILGDTINKLTVGKYCKTPG